MYLSYFGLNEPPFAITPDPRFVYLSSRHEDALAHLRYGLGQEGSGGFVQLTGEVGTGKTTLCRLLLEGLPERTRAALILNPLLDPMELLQSICQELGVSTRSAGTSPKKLVDRLNTFLLKAHANGETVVVIIDEAQNLKPESLEQVRLLTNLETSTRKLLQIILLGQPELRQLLARADLRQLAQRVTARFHLTPLNREETMLYVAHRLTVAGAQRNPFSSRALKVLFQLTGGVPRLINVVAERALLSAYAQSSDTITAPMVRNAKKEIDGTEDVPPGRAWWPVAALAGTVVAVAAVAFTVFDQQPPRTSPAVAESEPPIESPPQIVEPAIPTDSLVDAWATLMSHRGFSEQPLPPGGCSWQASSQLRCMRLRTTLDELLALDRPVLVAMPDGFAVAGPASGKGLAWRTHLEDSVVSLDVFERRWSGELWDVFALPGYVDQLVQEGDRGPAVLWVKEVAGLATPRYPGDRTDPYFGPSLKRWVEDFQTAKGIQPDGLIGPETLQQLSRIEEAKEHVDHS